MMRSVIENDTWGSMTHWRVRGGRTGYGGDGEANGYPLEVSLEFVECYTKRSKEALRPERSGQRRGCVTEALQLQMVPASTQVSSVSGVGL